MRRKLLSFIVLVSGAVGVGAANAAVTEASFQLRNTADLVDVCSATQSDPLYTAAVNFCQGFVVGVFRVLHDEDSASKRQRLFCFPSPAPSRNQGIQNFVQWAQTNPDQMNQQPEDSFTLFLTRNYACTRSSGSRG